MIGFAGRARRWLTIATVAAALLVAPRARASSSDDEHAAAVESFQRGTRLVEIGKLQDAIDAFRSALAHEPSGVGARLDLADCYEKVGAPAEAWRQYALAGLYAARAGDARVTMARTSAGHLEPQLLRIRLHVSGASASELRVDGETIEPAIAASGTVAVAPGRHRVEASAPGKLVAAQEVVGAAGETCDATLALDRAPTSTPPPEESAPTTGSQRTWALVVGGVGVAGVAAGSVLGLVAASKKSALDRESTDPSVGASRFASELSDAKTLASASTVLFVAGGAAIATGITLWLTARSPARASTLALRVVGTSDRTTLALGGTF